MSPALYAGLMSGTSLDGVDAVLASSGPAGFAVLGHQHQAFTPTLRAELLALNQSGGTDELQRAALAANGVADAYAELLDRLLSRLGIQAHQVRAAGAHGQTVRHRPDLGFTVQLLNGARLAERSGIAVVADLRSRDVAAGGQGAPLVPAFHRAVFGRPTQDIAVLNLGGMANLSLLAADGHTHGFDTGPGNVLLDLWHARHCGGAYDPDGAWAAGGQVQPALFARLCAEPYFALPPPRSTGRDLFDAGWLDRQGVASAPPQDVQATLSELTAWSVAEALLAHAPTSGELIVCGGGAFNTDLLTRLGRRLPGAAVLSSELRGLPPMQVEAAAFAWLAMRHIEGLAGNLPAVTGARGLCLLGALYPA